MERKNFIRKFAVGGSLLLTAPVIFSACSEDSEDVPNNNNNNNTQGVTVDLSHADFAALKTVGGYGYNDNIIIIRSTDTLYIALSKSCTHQGYALIFDNTSKQLVCNNHGSKFTTTGSVVTGPATSSLKLYDVKLSGTTLTIS